MMKNKENQTTYTSDFIGYVEDPKRNESGDMYELRVRFKDHEIKDMLDRYVTARDEDGKGGNVYVSLKKSSKGKWYCAVYNPRAKASEAAPAQPKPKASNVVQANDTDLPF
jgi:hypothetical protein